MCALQKFTFVFFCPLLSKSKRHQKPLPTSIVVWEIHFRLPQCRFRPIPKNQKSPQKSVLTLCANKKQDMAFPSPTAYEKLLRKGIKWWMCGRIKTQITEITVKENVRIIVWFLFARLEKQMNFWSIWLGACKTKT